jgi:methylglyoxal synthase
MIKVKIPRKELCWDFIDKLDSLCHDFELQAQINIVEVVPVPIQYITVTGELVVGEENND